VELAAALHTAEPVVVSALIEGLAAPVASSNGNILGQFQRTITQCHDTLHQTVDIAGVYSISLATQLWQNYDGGENYFLVSRSVEGLSNPVGSPGPQARGTNQCAMHCESPAAHFAPPRASAGRQGPVPKLRPAPTKISIDRATLPLLASSPRPLHSTLRWCVAQRSRCHQALTSTVS